MFTGTLLSSLLLLPLVYSNVVQPPEWSYENTNWVKNYPGCNGKEQSPINLVKGLLNLLPPPSIKFENYDVPFLGPLTVTNTGKTVEINLPPTTNGQRPSIRGARLDSTFELFSTHIHWGDLGNKGSEHAIGGVRFDAELHMVHKNVKYGTIDEAVKHKDGLAVLGIFLQIVENPDSYYPGLFEIFEILPYITRSQSSAWIDSQTTAEQFMGDANPRKFFTYSGSLTTPACAEAVTWHVFTEPLPVALRQMQNLWNLRDDKNKFLINNYRPLQPRNGRKIEYKEF